MTLYEIGGRIIDSLSSSTFGNKMIALLKDVYVTVFITPTIYLDYMRNKNNVKEKYNEIKAVINDKDDVDKFIVCSAGIGDTIMVAMLVKAYKEYYGYHKVYLVVKKSHADIGELFKNVDGVILLDNESMRLVRCNMMRNHIYEDHKLLYGNCIKVTDLQKNYKSFAAYYEKKILHIPEDSEREKADIKEYPVVDDYKDAILFMPYTISIKISIEPKVWEAMTAFFVKKGFRVFTNIRDESEECIKGTLPFMHGIRELVYYSGCFSAVIGARSGICDAAALNDKCNLSIIYPYEQYIDKWDMNYIASQKNVHTLVYHKGNEKEMVHELYRNIRRNAVGVGIDIEYIIVYLSAILHVRRIPDNSEKGKS